MTQKCSAKTNKSEPDYNCSICPRLRNFIEENKIKFPDKFNGPVPSFGPVDAKLLIVGLAPGLKGANFTGRPFTGDFAGDLLYSTLIKYGFAKGIYQARPDDGLTLHNCRITNAVRCVPPQNKPTGDEIKNCQPFFQNTMHEMPNLKAILALGKIGHDTIIRTHGEKLSQYKFAHNCTHELPSGIKLIDSYHCSRYNTQTGRLTDGMFHDVFDTIMDTIQ